MILVTGATGNNGTEIVKRLATNHVQVRTMVRNRERASAIALPHVEVVEGDFDRPATLLGALAGVERAFLLTNSSERAQSQQIAFIDAASGIAYTLLRPNLYMQGLLNFRSTIATQNAFYAAAGDAKVSVVDVRDIADVAVAALTEPGHEGKLYELTGPQALTHAEMAEALSKALGRQVAFVDIPPEAMRDALLGVGFPVWQADGLIEDYAHYRRGEAAAVTSGVGDAAGKAPRSFEEFAHDYAAMFS
jgi:uncharacterized protein YbjT (DUF2867 family)